MTEDNLPAPLDIDALRSLFRGGLDEALDLFLGVARGVAADLPGLLAGGDARALWMSGHKLVGSSRMAGAKVLLAACEAVCAAANAEDWPAAEAAVGRVTGEVARIEAWMAAWRDSSA